MKPWTTTHIKVKRKAEKAGLKLKETTEYRQFFETLLEEAFKDL